MISSTRGVKMCARPILRYVTSFAPRVQTLRSFRTRTGPGMFRILQVPSQRLTTLSRSMSWLLLLRFLYWRLKRLHRLLLPLSLYLKPRVSLTALLRDRSNREGCLRRKTQIYSRLMVSRHAQWVLRSTNTDVYALNHPYQLSMRRVPRSIT